MKIKNRDELLRIAAVAGSVYTPNGEFTHKEWFEAKELYRLYSKEINEVVKNKVSLINDGDCKQAINLKD